MAGNQEGQSSEREKYYCFLEVCYSHFLYRHTYHEGSGYFPDKDEFIEWFLSPEEVSDSNRGWVDFVQKTEIEINKLESYSKDQDDSLYFLVISKLRNVVFKQCVFYGSNSFLRSKGCFFKEMLGSSLARYFFITVSFTEGLILNQKEWKKLIFNSASAFSKVLLSSLI